jgi:hypothetical protein
MHCANPDCCCDTFDLPGGTLWRMELEESRTQPIENEDNGFPIRILPLKYFWLCDDCSKRFVLSQWTPTGMVLAPRCNHTQLGVETYLDSPSSMPPIRVHASASFEAEFQEAF